MVFKEIFYKMKIGEKIRLFAEKYYGSVSILAELLGMKSQSLYVYLNNESIPGGVILKKLQDLGCDINWLLSEDEKPPPETTELLQDRIKALEEENRLLRDSISQISLLTKAIEQQKSSKQPRRKH